MNFEVGLVYPGFLGHTFLHFTSLFPHDLKNPRNSIVRWERPLFSLKVLGEVRKMVVLAGPYCRKGRPACVGLIPCRVNP